MNKVNLIKHHNSWLVKIRLSIVSQYHSDIRFSYKGVSVNVVSTSHGFIKDNLLTLPKGSRTINAITEYIHGMPYIECFVTYYEPEIRNVIIKFDLPLTHDIQKLEPVFGKAKVIKNSIIYHPEWELLLDVRGDVHVSVIKSGQPTFLSFGVTGHKVDVSDYVFQVTPEINCWSIPKEIVWMKEKDYKGHDLRCFELVKVDQQNILYKVPISNALKLSNFHKKESATLSQFKDPLGAEFSPSLWHINNSQLPVYST